MAKLGETVQGMKEDFIVVHLQEPCSFCRCYISDQDRCTRILHSLLCTFGNPVVVRLQVLAPLDPPM